jgi:hypothetical protein
LVAFLFAPSAELLESDQQPRKDEGRVVVVVVDHSFLEDDGVFRKE